MPFNEKIKLRVKKKAHFKCCICESFAPLHIHHIITQADGGLDTFDNAAPLCPNCHTTYGSNPNHRKFIREKRDHWYEVCDKILVNDQMVQLEKAYMVIEMKTQKHEDNIINLREELNQIKNELTILQETNSLLLKQNQKLTQKIRYYPRVNTITKNTQMKSISTTIYNISFYTKLISDQFSALHNLSEIMQPINIISANIFNTLQFPKLNLIYKDFLKILNPFTRIRFPSIAPELIKMVETTNNLFRLLKEVKTEFSKEYPDEPIEIDGEFSEKFLEYFKNFKEKDK